MSTRSTQSIIKGPHLIIAGVAFLIFLYPPFLSCPVRHGPGEVAPREPEQKKIKGGQSVYLEGYQLHPVATFSITARVLSTQRYRMDPMSKISPVDLALGWGPMSDEVNLDQLKISQSHRFFYWGTKQFPIPRREIEHHSANMHLIPSEDIVRRSLLKIRKGQVVHLDGALVNVEGPNGGGMKTSKTRTDTGPGACEVVLVREVSVISKDALDLEL